MGCTGSKDKKPEDSDVPEKAPAAAADKPADTAPAGGGEKPKPGRADKSQDWMSDDLKELMQDYFNRYDLDGSQSINTSEELKQLCTNLVVKLDLDMDVADIDRVVNSAGPFADDNPQDIPEGTKPEALNNWNLQTFTKWFVQADNFKVDRNWMNNDQSDEEETPSDENPFLTGTYIGVLEGDGKKYTTKQIVGAKFVNGEQQGGEEKLCEEFMFKIKFDENDKTKLKERPGCDGCGLHMTSGSVDGPNITMLVEYDIDGNAGTKEPKLELKGVWGGADDPMTIKGEWTNIEPEGADGMEWIGLAGVSGGTFSLTKRQRTDE